MNEQLTKTFFDFGRQATDAALKANAIATKTFSEALEVQLAAAETQNKRIGDFWQESGDARNLEATPALWSKGRDVLQENLEHAIDANQKIFELGLNSSQEISDLFQGTFETAKGHTKKAATKAAKQ